MKIVKKVFLIIAIILMSVSLFLGVRWFVNDRFIKTFPNPNHEYKIMLLSFLNFYQPYVNYYNYGNFYYEQGLYEDAIEKYKKALTYDIPASQICDVEINLGLSLIELSTEKKKKDDRISLLEESKTYLNKCISREVDDIYINDPGELEKNKIKDLPIDDKLSPGGQQREQENADDSSEGNKGGAGNHEGDKGADGKGEGAKGNPNPGTGNIGSSGPESDPTTASTIEEKKEKAKTIEDGVNNTLEDLMNSFKGEIDLPSEDVWKRINESMKQSIEREEHYRSTSMASDAGSSGTDMPRGTGSSESFSGSGKGDSTPIETPRGIDSW